MEAGLAPYLSSSATWHSLRSGDRSQGRPAAVRQAFFHETSVPVDELHHAPFMYRRIRAWFVGRRLDASRIVLNDPAILIVGLGPNMNQFFETIVDALHRILVHQPFCGDGGLCSAERQDAERN